MYLGTEGPKTMHKLFQEKCSQCKAHEDIDLAYTRGLGEGILKGPGGGAPEAENWRGIRVGRFNWLKIRSCPPFSGGEKVKGVVSGIHGPETW